MGAALSGESKMPIGKIFPINVRALHLVFSELLRGFVEEMVHYDVFTFFLDGLAIKGYLANHCMNSFIKTAPKNYNTLCPSRTRSRVSFSLACI